MPAKKALTKKCENHLQPLWSVHSGAGPVFATALHAGHDIRADLAQFVALDEASRLREEDPYTDILTHVVANRIEPLRSRFEVDLNRARNEAVYLSAQDAWGLEIWKKQPTAKMIEQSLNEFDLFYAQTKNILKQLESDYGRFVVFDIHSYNYRRAGPNAEPDNPSQNPDINIGTGTMDRQKWAKVIDRFINDLQHFDYLGQHLDVRENVKFRGRQFATWVHQNFPDSGCVLSIELKKIFMNEWTGKVDIKKLFALFSALKSTLPGISEELQRL
jgi:N-formylglutamate deformylase